MTGTFVRCWKNSAPPLLALSFLLCGCGRQPAEPTPPALVPAKSTQFLGNGTMGFRVGDFGLGNGLPAFSLDSYQKTGEEKIVPVPHPLNGKLEWELNGKRMAARLLRQTQTWEVGKVITKGTAQAGGKQWEFTAETAVNSYLQLTWSLQVSGDAVPIYDGKPLTEEIRIPVAGRIRVPRATLTIESTDKDDERFVQIASQRLQTELPEQPRQFAPMGLSSEIYFGHTFWDADVWMMPVLVWLAPDSANALAQFRLQRLPQAKSNFSEWLADGTPIGKGKLDLSGARVHVLGAMFPWESSVSGRETVPGPSRFQHHISGSVMLGLERAKDFLPQLNITDAGRSVASFYQSRAQEVRPGEQGIFGTMSPDEHHTGDNDLYTNILAEQVVRSYADPTWTAARPRDATTFLTYNGDRLRTYKQAAALLSIYPLQDPAAEKEASQMLTRFAGKVIDNGPAMSHAIDATVRARFGDVEQAYREWRDSWVPYTTDGDLFREKKAAQQDRSIFYTGMAGSLQTVIYGFGGARIDDKPSGLKLPSGRYLSFKPRLPQAWNSIRLSGIVIGTKTYDIAISKSGAHINSRGN
ncbi:MAG: hypothetical protein JNJ45_12195 [Chthonomonas sp.]|nr:hypothetical protein [Chthonomonas sp.]